MTSAPPMEYDSPRRRGSLEEVIIEAPPLEAVLLVGEARLAGIGLPFSK